MTEDLRLRDTLDLLRRTIDGIDGIVSYLASAGGPVVHSAQIERILGVAPDALVDQASWVALVHPDDRARCLATWDGPDDAWELEYRMRRNDDDWIWVRDRARRTRLPDGRTDTLSSIVVDVTAQRQAEEAATDSRAAFTALFEHAPLGSYIYKGVRDASGATVDWVVTEANARACAWMELPREQVVGRPVSELMAALFPALQAAATPENEAKDPLVIELGPDASGRYFLVSVFLIDGERNAAVSQDVTELHEARSAAGRAERMAALGQLASGVSHDFKNLLWGIDLHAGFIRAAAGVPEPIRGDAAMIQEAVARGMAVSRQLMDFARPKSPTEDVHLGDAIRELEPLLSRLAGPDCVLGLDLPDLPGRARIDRGQLEQILVNLVMNAHDAMPDGGTVTIATSAADLDGAAAAELAVAPGAFQGLTVSDTGAGMTRGTLERVFEPYFTTKPAGKGTGLGLATTYGVVRAAGGSIRVESAPGAGTTVRILLPASPPDEADLTPA